MPNDTKLGLLMGVAGVVVAAVLFFQDKPPAVTAQPSAATVAKPSQIFGKKPDAPSDPATLPAQSRSETDGQPVARTGK
jgi:hypothetical protein